jgi:hypothetical protein
MPATTNVEGQTTVKQVDRVALEARLVRELELAIAWGLPEAIIEPCAHHHDDPEKASRLVKMVMMSDILVAIIERRQMAAAAAKPAPAEPATDPATTDDAPSATDGDDALGPTSAVWPTSFTDPPGAPDPKSGTLVASRPTASKPSSPVPPPVDLDAPDFAKLEALGMSREIAEMILTRLDESLIDLPL